MSEKIQTQEKLHNFNLSTFAAAYTDMVATSDSTYGSRTGDQYRSLLKNYTAEEVLKIIESGSLEEQRTLSRVFFNKDGYYKQLILYLSTLPKYTGILIPSPASGKKLSTPHIQKKYYQAMDYIDKMSIQSLCVDWAQKILVDGCYYGLVHKVDKLNFSIINLPASYCMTRFKDYTGNDVIEFDLSYFNSISDKTMKKAALAAYPDFISKSYEKWAKGKLKNRWVVIPSELGICFPMFDGRPFFLNIIPSTIKYEEAVETEQEKAKKEIEKIIVQQIPHLSDGRLLFEPDEAVQMHKGAVGMVKNTKNTTVLTTYANVEAIGAKSSADTTNNTLDRMKQNIYSQAGVSSEIFAATGGNTTETSIKFDTAIMMYLCSKFARFITNTINANFSNSNISFKYSILPITHQNESKYIDGAYKLATAGYSLIVPALAQGFSQKDLVNIKDLENDVLLLTDRLLPPKTSYTQSAEEESNNGRPAKEAEDKKDQTIANEKSIEKSNTQGGSE